ncbi:MAG TPA: ATP-dependent helicase HrpB, partial [Pirellulales bacterium]|nr:ATP-dependent helicase HrpB [Pirellulales bacterium]
MRDPLPIDAVLPELIAKLAAGSVAVLRAPPGAGKTTRVPPAMLDAGLAADKQIVMLEPRRLAARAAAARIAAKRGTPLGDEIGYQVRFERRAGRATRILVVTEGIFLRLLQDDPLLEHVGAVVFDEFHERNLDSDLALAMVRRVQTEVRPELKIVVMSATLDAAPLTAFLGNCPLVESQGRLFPVEVRYLHHAPQEPLASLVARQVGEALDQTSGDVLVFLPGVREIRRAGSELQPLARERNLALCELYGDLPLEEQQAVLRRADRRKIVLSTNVAESSVTIEGISAVVDSGLARVLRFDAALGLNRLDVERISQASAEQRAGRAGRTGPGLCLRLWTQREQHALRDIETPEVQRVDLSGAALQLLCWGERDWQAFPWFDPPPTAAVNRAQELLARLGAVDARGVTDLGSRMNRLPVQPRIARLLIAGHDLGHSARAALLAAFLSERDPLPRSGRGDRSREPQRGSDSDVLDRLAVLEQFAAAGRRHSGLPPIDPGAARFVLRARDQLAKLVEQSPRSTIKAIADEDEAMLRALLAAFSDRLARRREPHSRRAVMVGGRGVRLADESGVTEPELFVCVDLAEQGQAESLVRQASLIKREWIDPDRLQTTIDVEFDAQRERVIALRRTRYEDLVLDEAVTSVPSGYDAAPLLAREAAARLDDVFQLGEAEAGFLARVQSLRSWMPELELPDLRRENLGELLPTLCAGCSSFAELRRVPLVPIWKSLLTSAQRAALEREAPERWTVPSGSSIALVYEPGKPPVLAVRIQEIFGLKQTPRIAAGRVRVLLHLLGPNYRPQQITDDLESFWKNTYAEVRKELRRRYPKHA